MRKATLALTVLMLAAGPQAALALDADDTMAAWAAASASERSELVDRLMAKATAPRAVSRPALLECLNQASGVSGHAQLTIDEIAEACSHPAKPGDQAQAEAARGRSSDRAETA